MPPPKKAAKKTAGHHHGEHHEANDMRRAYEHLGRLEILQKSLKSSGAKTVVELTKLAQGAISGGHNKEAADLLRASEHLGFALLGGNDRFGGNVSPQLERSIVEHFDELMHRAEKHWKEEKRSSILREIYASSCESASRAFRAHAYHQALEFARASEALAHVKLHGPLELGSGHKTLRLESE